MQTNRDHYNTDADPGYTPRAYDGRCAHLGCQHCRHGRAHRNFAVYPFDDLCTASWLAAPHDQPLDIRIPWAPQPPEVEPNPL